MYKKQIKVACVGAGYFAQFHLEAWQRLEAVELIAICDQDEAKAIAFAKKYGALKVYTDVDTLLEQEAIEVLDIITPPETHYDICRKAALQGIHIICQKPLAPTLEEAKAMVELTQEQGVHFMVHENWRFQPWYRQIKRMLDAGQIGDKIHSLYFRMRMGDGWAEDAYLNRQPYFRTMPRLLVYETGIHFIDTFRFLLGEVDSVMSDLRKLNPDIAGEDCGIIFFNFANGSRAIWDANRYNESNLPNPRYTFGELLLEGNGGSIRLYSNGKITLQTLGEDEKEIPYIHEDKNFAGDCVYHLQKNFVECYQQNLPFENSGAAYLRNLEIQEAVYGSAEAGYA
ncbi:MAG: Gfo/Idh/MocA family oxidoreductase, partial [Bacteroidota bacterium]